MSGFLPFFIGAAISVVAIHYMGLNLATMIAVPVTVIYLIYQRIA